MEKSQLSVKTLTSVLTVKLNLRDVSCSDMCAILQEDSALCKKIHTTEKYNIKS